LIDNLPPAKKYPPVDLEEFVAAAKCRMTNMPILKKLGFVKSNSTYKELKPFKPKKVGTTYYDVCFKTNDRVISLHLFPTAGGYFTLFIKRSGGKASDSISLSRYFELYDKDSVDVECLKLRNFKGPLEEKVEQSLQCINRILENSFEKVLKGEEWIEVTPDYYDYK
jgi:hypothetical protein